MIRVVLLERLNIPILSLSKVEGLLLKMATDYDPPVNDHVVPECMTITGFSDFLDLGRWVLTLPYTQRLVCGKATCHFTG